MPLALRGELEGLVWLPDREAGDWHMWCPLLVMLVGTMSYRQEANAIGDGSCGACAASAEKLRAQPQPSSDASRAVNSQPSSRGPS
jgi:hypothetical protein